MRLFQIVFILCLNSFIGPFSLSSFRFTNYIEMEKAADYHLFIP